MKFALFLPLVFLAVPSAFAAETKPVPVVVELYTSQSCSSCPKADALLVKLAQDPSMITVGCHVTYWNHLSWKDTVSLEACTQRQKDFGQKLSAGQIYTPEIIVNGREAMVGYRDDLVHLATVKQRTDRKTLPLDLEKEESAVKVTFPALPGGRQIPYIVTLMAYGAPQTVKIGSGENSGETVTYAKPVTFIKRLDFWQGKGEVKRVPLSLLPKDAKGAVLTVQPEEGAPIVAAGEVSLN